MVIPSPEIKQLILDWYRQIALGDMIASAEHVLSHEQAFSALGTGAAEWYKSCDEIIKMYGEAAKLGNPEINIQQIDAYQEGSVGWAVDMVIFRRPGMNKLMMRHTFVLHQENGEWKVVHAHYSFPVPDEVG